MKVLHEDTRYHVGAVFSPCCCPAQAALLCLSFCFFFEVVVNKEGGTVIHAPAHEWEHPISSPLLTNQALEMLHHLPLPFSHTMLRDAADPLAIGGHHSRTILPSNLLHSCSHLPHDMGISRGIELKALSFVSPSNSLLFSSKAAWKTVPKIKQAARRAGGRERCPLLW